MRAQVSAVPGPICIPLLMNAHQKIHIFDINLSSLYRGLCPQLLVHILSSENLICSHMREQIKISEIPKGSGCTVLKMNTQLSL